MSDANGFYLQRLIEERDELKRERDHYKALASPTAREGWKLVPVEPTDEQIAAMTHAEPLTYFPLKLAAEGRRKQYRAAIKAAPPSPDGGGRD